MRSPIEKKCVGTRFQEDVDRLFQIEEEAEQKQPDEKGKKLNAFETGTSDRFLEWSLRLGNP